MSTINSYKYNSARIIQFAKAPVEGLVKTRLIPAIGQQAACALHEKMLEQALIQLTTSHIAPVYLYGSDCNNEALQAVAKKYRVPLYEQQGSDLGEKMHCAIAETFGDKAVQYVVLVGSDCLGVNAEYLEQALMVLESGHDLVIGPATDGGYVLIAMACKQGAVFQDITWGSNQVLIQTQKAAKLENLSVELLSPLADIDRAEDLPLLEEYGIVVESND